MSDRQPFGSKNTNLFFRWAAMAFGVALAIHGADHLRRGIAATPPAVMIAGSAQLLLAAVTLALVFTASRWAPYAAIAVGFASALGFTAAHLLPHWGFFSDSFINAPPAARVTTFSWVSAVAEIVADILFGIAGIAVLRARGRLREELKTEMSA
jgi:uncharacterized membrane protein (DUF485 family)